MKSSFWSLKSLRSLMFICAVAALLIPLVSSQKSDARLMEAQATTGPVPANNVFLHFAAEPQMLLLLPTCTPPTGLIISEFRFRGAAGPNDEFIELYNATDASITVCTADGSAGWAVASRNATATSTMTLFVIPNGTIIPGRGHYLGTNNSVNGYSLGLYPAGNGTTATPDVTYPLGVDDNAGIALFNTANSANFSTSTRLDAIGFSGPTGAIADLYREGAGYPPIGTLNGQYALLRRTTNFLTADANDNANDLWFVSTTAGTFGGVVPSSIGAPGPENLSSPVLRNSILTSSLLDTTVVATVAPNRVRDLTPDPANNSTAGTMTIRRRLTNTSGGAVTRLRLHVANTTTYPPPAGGADLRLRSIGTTTISNVNDPVTCAATGTPATPPCTVTVQGTTLEEPPTQSMGGGYNSTLIVNLPQPLAAGASLNVQYLLGVQQSGNFSFQLNNMGLPSGNVPAAPSNLGAAGISASQINLVWIDNSSDETGFKIERKTGPAGTYAEIATVGANVTGYSNAGLSSNTQYYYRVRATNAVGDSAYSTEANATTFNMPPSVSLTVPSNNQSFTAPANITLAATASDSDGTITKVQFFQGTTLLNEDTSAPFSFAWNNAAAGSYSLTARAFDNAGATTSSAVVAIAVNAPPTVSLIAPTNGQVFTAPANITLTASAADADGTISKVQFFQGTTLLNEDTSAPYSFAWNNAGAGSYSLTAKAFDNAGATTPSAAVVITVNTLPTVSLTAPTNGQIFAAPANITLTASASDSDGTIAKVQFFQGTTLLNEDTSAPYSFDWNNVGAGSYSLTAKAFDNLGGATTSAVVAITVNALPTVSLTAPTNGQVFTAPASITLTASASDSDGSIAKVQFFQGTTLLNEDTSAPYSFAWNNVDAGSYSLTAKAFDNLGGTTTSATVAITVNTLPTVSISSPTHPTTFTAAANFTITATASDPDGSISKVEFFAGALLLGEDTSAPYAFAWSNVGRGSYVLTAKATDNLGGSGTSTSVSAIVTDAPTTSITSPGNNVGFVAGSPIVINALAADDGSVAKVEFFQNGVLLGEDTTAPYSFAWANVPPGTYALTTRATDDLGITANSTVVNVNVITTNEIARLDPMNRTGGGGEDPLSRNYNWSVPLLALPGRAGLDLGLTLSYNSLVWTKSGNFITFDDDAGFPSPGFHLGFPVIQAQYFNAEAGKNAYLLITSDGGRIELRQVGTSALYEAADSSHLLLDSSTMILRSTDGIQLQYVWKGSGFQCTQIKDRNGNFITINYTGFGRIDTIVDTLARTIKFNYNADNTLASISQTWSGQSEPHVWASFTYQVIEVQTNFVNVTNVGPVNGSTINVLHAVKLNDNSQYVFDYTSWAQVSKLSNFAADGHLLNYRAYNLPLNGSSAWDGCPRFTERRDWAENWNRGGAAGASGLPAGSEQEVLSASWAVQKNVSWTMPDGMQQTGTVVTQTTPADGSYNKIYFAGESGTASGWQRGLVTLVETFGSSNLNDPIIKQRSVSNKWTQDATNVAYVLNPRLEETNVYDYNLSGQVQNRARTRFEFESIDLGNGMTCHLPSDTYEYQANASTVLRRTHTDYNLAEAYINRRVLGLVSEKSLYEIDPSTLAETLMSRVGLAYDEAGSIQGNDAPVQHDTSYNSNFVSGRGNLSSVKRYDVVNAGQFTLTAMKFNTAGAVVLQIDPLNHQQSISYADSYSDGNNGRNTLAYPTTATDADGFSSTAQYNFNFGAVTRTQTPPPAGQTVGAIKHFSYDSAARFQKVAVEFNGNANYSYTRFEYPESQNRVDMYTTIQEGLGEAHSFKISDGHGRVFASAADHPGSVGGFSGQLTLFDAMGRAIKRSNPAETNANGTPFGWVTAGDDAATSWLYTQQTYDWKGRPLVTTNTDGTTKEASYSGCGCAGGEVVTLTDEGAVVDIDPGPEFNNVIKKRQQKIYADVIGRTVKTEVLNWDGAGLNGTGGTVYSTTTFSYNARDQVTLARQFAGSTSSSSFQETTSSYDGFGRLKTQHQPEQQVDVNNGASTDHTTWNYSNDDTIQSVVDARGVITNFTYNARHLPTLISFDTSNIPASSNVVSTANIVFAYDAAGNRTSMSDGSGVVDYHYNQLSRMEWEQRSFSGLPNAGVFRLNYEYNLGGSVTKVTDERAGTSFTETVDKVGRVTAVNAVGLGGTPTQFVSEVQYRAWGGLKSRTQANSTLSLTYNSRLLPRSYALAGAQMSYEYHNDGAIKFADAQSGLVDVKDRAYAYDAAGRLQYAYSGVEARNFVNNTTGGTPDGPYSHEYAYDHWGNMIQDIGRFWSRAVGTQDNYDASNRNSFWSYDASGNLLSRHEHIPGSQPPTDPLRYKYDAAGRQVGSTRTYSHITEFGFLTLEMVNSQTFDGDNRAVHYSLVRNSTLSSVLHGSGTTEAYLLCSTVLGGRVVSEYKGDGTWSKTHVYAGAERLGQQTTAEVGSAQSIWETLDPVTGDGVQRLANGHVMGSTTLDPGGVNVGASDPFPPDGSGDLDGLIDPFAFKTVAALVPIEGGAMCILDGMDIPCSRVSGNASVQCPNNNCGPQRLTVTARSRGEVVATATFFAPPGWDSSLDGTYSVNSKWMKKFMSISDGRAMVGGRAFVSVLMHTPLPLVEFEGDVLLERTSEDTSSDRDNHDVSSPNLQNPQTIADTYKILDATTNKVFKRLEDRSCIAIFDKSDPHFFLANLVSISTQDQMGNPFLGEGHVARTIKDPYKGKALPSGSIVFNQNGFFFTGKLNGVNIANVLTDRVRQANGLGNLTFDEIQELILIHELVHINDTAGIYADMGQPNAVLNNYIRANCFGEKK